MCRPNFGSKIRHNDSCLRSLWCFYCGKAYCAMATCKIPKDENRIPCNLARWHGDKNMRSLRMLHFTEVAEHCQSVEEAGEVLYALQLMGLDKQSESDSDSKDNNNSSADSKVAPILHTALCRSASSQLEPKQ